MKNNGGDLTALEPGDLADGALQNWNVADSTAIRTSYDELSNHPGLVNYIAGGGGALSKAEGDRRASFEACRVVETFLEGTPAGVTGGLDGQRSDGSPLMPPPLQVHECRYVGAPFWTDFRNAGSLSAMQIMKIGNFQLDLGPTLQGIDDVLTGTTSPRNPTGDTVDLSGFTFYIGWGRDHTHGALDCYFGYQVFDEVISRANAPSLVLPNRSVPGQIVSVTPSADTITVDDPNGDIKDFYDTQWDNWANGASYYGAPTAGVYLMDAGLADDAYGIDQTTSTKGVSHDSGAGETTVTLSVDIPSDAALRTESTGWIKGG